MKATITLHAKDADVAASADQIKVLRSYPKFSCRIKDEYLLKKLRKKQASEIIVRLKNGEEIELKS